MLCWLMLQLGEAIERPLPVAPPSRQLDLKPRRGAFEWSSASTVSPAIAFEPTVTKGRAGPGI